MIYLKPKTMNNGDVNFNTEISDNEDLGITPAKINKSLASKRLSLSELEKHLNN